MGNVIPKLDVIDSDGLASGWAIPTAAGAAIYEALAANTPKIVAPPTESESDGEVSERKNRTSVQLETNRKTHR
jgi:hypothetical protein